ncbi:hypothetical protein EMPS_10621 [Entomortierella parvispora]|uniref:Reverse transcriptase RNase H-like domain-containing protein n=1 Tax=Entomortierella parvispora TaxID=205924 RepID=A0A9P3M1I0_9FUNG|nr:hypothetical protein EMPS_10621 [Entomortierella parvispora]
MQSAERNYPVHEQELLAVIHALRTWRYYLDGTKFSVHTDHATLRHFPTQPKLTRRQARWMELLQEYDFDFKYKRGVDNIVPDALSRRPDYREPDPVELYDLSVVMLSKGLCSLCHKDQAQHCYMIRYNLERMNWIDRRRRMSNRITI